MKLPKKYSEDNLARIAETLPFDQLDEEMRRLVRSWLEGSAIQYQRMRQSFDEHRRRHDTTRQLLEDIEAIEQILELEYFHTWESNWSDASDKEVFEAGVKMAGRYDDRTSLWAQPAYAEISRRTIESLKARLQMNLDYVDPFAMVNRVRPPEEKVPTPARNDKRPERQFVQGLLRLFARVHQIGVGDVQIGNDPKANGFLRFARACVDPINKHAFTDYAIRDHARAVRKTDSHVD